jgi:dipeptidyl aminopeptidase/acylaminoacyl peptidase
MRVKLRNVRAALAVLLSPWMPMSAPALEPVQEQTEPSRIDIGTSVAAGPKRPISLDDMVSLRAVHEPRQSPDGRRVAFLVRQAFRDCNCSRTALYVVSAKGRGAPVKLLEEGFLRSIQWMPDSRIIAYLSAKSGAAQLWEIDADTRKAQQVFTHTVNRDQTLEHLAYRASDTPPVAVLEYRLSHDGKMVAFTAEPPIDPAINKEAAKRGFRYDDETMRSGDLLAGDSTSALRTKQLWVYEVAEHRERVLWTTPPSALSSVGTLVWSHDDRRLAFVYNDEDLENRIGLADVDSGHVSVLGRAGGDLYGPGSLIWAPDGESVLVAARPRIATAPESVLAVINVHDGTRRELSRHVAPSLSPWLSWDEKARRIFFGSGGIGPRRNQTGLYSMSESGGDIRRVTPVTEMTSECDAPSQGEVVCVRQSPSLPPAPARVSLRSGTAQPLAEINPELATITLGPVEELHWVNAYGDETNGFLVLPPQRTPGVRLPLVIVGYGFDGEFVTQANETLTTYPAQALARDGMAVLLYNYPRWKGWDGNDFARGSVALGYSPLSSLEAIVGKLSAQGLIDPAHVGMMGHSLAGFWVQLAISHSNLFKAVELHNGGTFSEPGTFWSSGAKWARDMQEHIMGGPPYGDTLRNYLAFSMTLNADKIRAPVLMEYDALGAQSAMEYYSAFRTYGVPVDFFVYPNDGHITEQPEHRFASLQRNLDWFEFWLLNKENDPDTKGDQYTRWRQFRLVREEQESVKRDIQ